MRREHDGTQLRRYVLGALTAEERAGIEDEYFERADVLGRVCAAEEDLIDDYLSDRLASDEHERFERYYLAVPGHRTRVAVARELRTAAASSASALSAESSEHHDRVTSWWEAIRAWPSLGQAALVAALLLLVAGGVWMLRERSEPTTISVRTPPPSVSPTTSPEPRPPDLREPAAPSPPDAPPPARATPVVLALSLSPIHVRGADEPARLTIPKGTDIVRLDLQGEPGQPRLERGRAIVRTVAGHEVWRGRATGVAVAQRSALVRIDIPAARLRPNDYIVELLDADVSVREAERYRYFFRVRREQDK
jgi:anti-sigma-K factor RskA